MLFCMHPPGVAPLASLAVSRPAHVEVLEGEGAPEVGGDGVPAAEGGAEPAHAHGLLDARGGEQRVDAVGIQGELAVEQQLRDDCAQGKRGWEWGEKERGVTTCVALQ